MCFIEDCTIINNSVEYEALVNKFGTFNNVDNETFRFLTYLKHDEYDFVVSYQAVDKLGEDGKPTDQSVIQAWKLVAYSNDKYYLFDAIPSRYSNSNVIFRSVGGFERASMSENPDVTKDKAIEFKRLPIPSYDRICILPLDRNEEEGITDGSTHKQLESGLFVPDTQKVIGKYGERRVEYEIDYDWGIIVAMGPGDIDRTNGTRLPMEHSIMDKVIIPPNYGSPFFVDDVEYRMVRDSDIMCKIEY